MRIWIRIQLITLMRARILPSNLMRIHSDPGPQHCVEYIITVARVDGWSVISAIPPSRIDFALLVMGAMMSVIHIEVKRTRPGSIVLGRHRSRSHFQSLITSYFEVGSPVGIRRSTVPIHYVTLATYKMAVIIVE
jgi:hypothetical protein